MTATTMSLGTIGLTVLLGLAPAACNPRGSGNDDAGPAPVDTTTARIPADTTLVPGPDTSVATPPINPSPAESRLDTPPAGAAKPSQKAAGARSVSRLEYDGWRQYSVNCARCHGQDALPNPVAANLLVSLGRGGPIDTPEKFIQVVSEGRPERGMPAFKGVLTPEQTQAIYAYLKGRAEKRIPPGRPAQPQG
jgi:polar amino acid transport system substrate-binding protein